MYNNRRKGEDMFKLKKEKSPFNLNEKEEQVMKFYGKMTCRCQQLKLLMKLK